MKSKVAAFGEILWDIIYGEHHLGGAPLNFSAHVYKQGLEASIISAVGDDELGVQALESISNIGVNTDNIQKNDRPTGTVPVVFDSGQPDYTIIENVAYDYIEQVNMDFLTDADVLYFGTLIQRNSVSKKTLYSVLDSKEFEEIFYDVNLRKNCFSKTNILQSLQYATILKLNDEEVEVLSPLLYGRHMSFRDFCKQINADFPQVKVILITAGGDGSYFFVEGEINMVKAESIKVEDTIGAGDSFSATFLVQYLKTDDPLKSVKMANKVGGFVASKRGPIPDYTPDIARLLVGG